MARTPWHSWRRHAGPARAPCGSGILVRARFEGTARARPTRALATLALVTLACLVPPPAAAQFQGDGGWVEPEAAPPTRRARGSSGSASADERRREEPRTMEPDARSTEPRPEEARPAPPPEPPPRPALGGRKALVAFEASPFPYDGTIPPDDKPFFDVTVDGRRGRLSPRTGNVLWEAETYSDRRVLLYVPRGFTLAKPGHIVLFLHGNGARLVRDVERRQAVLHQVEASRLNAVVVAPQLAVDAPDSSPGAFWRPGMLATFLEEAAVQLAKLHPGSGGADRKGRGKSKPRTEPTPKPLDAFRHMPVVVVAYSGGYLATAWMLHHGGAEARVVGAVVLDGMYGEQAKFAEWLERRRDGFLVSAYGPSSQEGNVELRRLLGERESRLVQRLDGRIARGSVTFVAVAGEVRHADFVTQAWIRDPLADALSRLPR